MTDKIKSKSDTSNMAGKEDMNRVIKFRAWDKENKKFFYPAPRIGAMTISITLNGEIIGHPNIGEVTDNYELSQFTGLTDIEGKEVFEGDTGSNEAAEWEVVFNKGCFCAKRLGVPDTETHLALRAIRGFKVTGNKYEQK